MKLWLKVNPEITCQTLAPDPINGHLPALCHCPREDPELIYAVILPEEWSTTEIIPAPAVVPDMGYLVLYGEDPARVKYLFMERETDAAVAVATRNDAFGYVPISIQRNAMIGPNRVELDGEVI